METALLVSSGMTLLPMPCKNSSIMLCTFRDRRGGNEDRLERRCDDGFPYGFYDTIICLNVYYIYGLGFNSRKHFCKDVGLIVDVG